MVELLNLSPELVLCIASHLQLVDLLNISLTCHHLRDVTEPELYREYSNPLLRGRSFAPFLKRLVEHQNLRKYVHRLELKAWDSIDVFNPDHHSGSHSMEQFLPPQPSEADYRLLSGAAKDVGLISCIWPYTNTSVVVDRARAINDAAFDETPWCDHIYGLDISIDKVSYDQKFCQLLRAGIEDSYVALLLALLPNVREMFLHGGPIVCHTLPWKVPEHNFASLRKLGVTATDGELEWPIAFFNDVLAKGKLEYFETYMSSSWWWRNTDPGIPTEMVSFSLPPKSLDLKRIVLERCTLDRSAVRDLINACRNLEWFYYSSGTRQENPEYVAPSHIIELLRPHKDSLVDLYIDLDLSDDLDTAHEGIQSLAHFTRLENVDTAPELWDKLLSMDIETSELEERDRLCNRLPPHIITLIFHECPGNISPHQICDLLRAREEKFTSLEYLTLTAISTSPELDHELSSFEEFYVWDEVVPLSLSFHPKPTVVLDHLVTRTELEDIPHPSTMAVTRLIEGKYVCGKPKSRRRLEAYDRYAEDAELTNFDLDDESDFTEDSHDPSRGNSFLDIEDLDDFDAEDDEENSE